MKTHLGRAVRPLPRSAQRRSTADIRNDCLVLGQLVGDIRVIGGTEHQRRKCLIHPQDAEKVDVEHGFYG